MTKDTREEAARGSARRGHTHVILPSRHNLFFANAPTPKQVTVPAGMYAGSQLSINVAFPIHALSLLSFNTVIQPQASAI